MPKKAEELLHKIYVGNVNNHKKWEFSDFLKSTEAG
jgi:hypothetical protein